jgi:hypothetical protein
LIKLFFLILQVVGLASTLLQLVGLTCLIADTLEKTLENELTTSTIDNYLYLSSR